LFFVQNIMTLAIERFSNGPCGTMQHQKQTNAKSSCRQKICIFVVIIAVVLTVTFEIPVNDLLIDDYNDESETMRIGESGTMKSIRKQLQYTLKQSFSQDATSPHSIYNLNDSLFCPLISRRDQRTYWEPLRYIHSLQFAPRQHPRYLLMPYFRGAGVGSTIESEIAAFTVAMALNRTFLRMYSSDKMHGNWKWLPHRNGKNVTLCQGRLGRDCAFYPHSVLTDDEIVRITKLSNTTTEGIVLDCSLKDETLEVLQSVTASYPLVVLDECWNRALRQVSVVEPFLKQQTLWKLRLFQWIALCESFLLRFRENVRRQMDHRLGELLTVRYRWNGSARTIALPIRGSDKCSGDDAEMQCLAIERYPEIISFLKREHSDIDSVIVTSEDPAVIKWIKGNLSVDGVDVIFNDFDDVPGTGSYGPLHREKDDTQTLDSFLAIWLTVKLQLNARYYVINRHSNLLHQMWLMADNMDCHWNQRLDVDINARRMCVDTATDVTHIMWSRCYRKTWNLHKKNKRSCISMYSDNEALGPCQQLIYHFLFS